MLRRIISTVLGLRGAVAVGDACPDGTCAGQADDAAMVQIASTGMKYPAVPKTSSFVQNSKSVMSSEGGLLGGGEEGMIKINKDGVDNTYSLLGATTVDGGHGVEPRVCVIARYALLGDLPHENIVKAFLASLLVQRYSKFEVHLVNGVGGGEILEHLVQSFDDARVTNGPSSAEIFKTNTWGYEATNFAMNELLARSEDPCEYFLFTNADNLYNRKLFSTTLPNMKADVDLIGFNFVTHYRRDQQMQDAGFQEKHVDLGAALVKAQAIRESRAQFGYGKLADWHFFEQIIEHGGSQTWHQETLFFHQ